MLSGRAGQGARVWRRAGAYALVLVILAAICDVSNIHLL
jgi:hypothetical protein